MRYYTTVIRTSAPNRLERYPVFNTVTNSVRLSVLTQISHIARLTYGRGGGIGRSSSNSSSNNDDNAGNDDIIKAGSSSSKATPIIGRRSEAANNSSSKMSSAASLETPCASPEDIKKAIEVEVELKVYSLDEVREHDVEEDAWMVVFDYVYDLTEFLNQVKKIKASNLTCRFKMPELIDLRENPGNRDGIYWS